MRIGSKASGIGLFLLVGTVAVVGCGGDDDGGATRTSGGRGGTAATAGTGGSAGGTTAGTGGSTGGTGGTTAVAPACPVAESLASPAILSFDDGAVQDAAPSLGMYVYAAEGGTITPAAGLESAGIKEPGADSSSGAFSFVGTGFPADAYGGGLGVWMNCRDASAATGIKFWLKSDVPVLVKVEVPANKKIADGGECAGDDTTCQQARFQLEATGGTWAEREVPFTSLTGGMPVSTFDPSKITGIGFEVVKPTAAEAGWGWDISIDQVEWTGMAGTGAGGAPGVGGAGSEGGNAP